MKNTDQITKIRSERLKSLLLRNNLKQCDLCKNPKNDESGNTTFTESEISDFINGKRLISEKKAKQLIEEFFPDVRLSWLLGIDEYMTENDRIVQRLESINTHSDCMWGIINESLRPHNMELKFIHRQGEHVDAVSRVKKGREGECWYEITTNNGKPVKLTVDDVIQWEKEIQQYADFITFNRFIKK